LNEIDYGAKKIPSWSWQVLYGKVEFAVPIDDKMQWITSIRFKKGNWLANLFPFITARLEDLFAEIASFRAATLNQAGLRCEIVNEQEQNVGWIQYDRDHGDTGLDSQKCVVLGREVGNKEKYYGLVVKPTAAEREFVRIGIAYVDSFHLSRMRGEVRIV
jgi:hypothetical protein